MREVIVSWLWLLRRSRGGLMALLAGLALFEFIQPVAISSFGDLDRLQGVLDLIPTPFLALLNITPEFLEAAGLAGYLSLGFSHPVYFLLSGATVIWFTARGLAGEMERGSIQIALSRPMSRAQVYSSRLLGLVTVTVMVSIAGPAGMIAGINAASPDGSFQYRHFLALGAASALLSGSIGGAALLISASAQRMGQAIGFSIALLVTSYVVDYFADLWGTLEPLEPFSIFDYYDPAQALTWGDVPLTHMLALGAVAGVGALAGLVVFTRRDMP